MLSRLLRTLFRRGEAPAHAARADTSLDSARARLAAGDVTGAVRSIDDALRAYPQSVEVCNGAGILKRHMRDYAGARRCFERILELAPEHGEARTNLAIVLLEQGHRGAGVGHLREAITQAPQLLSPRENLAILLTHELSPDAVPAWDEVLKLAPDHAKAHAGKAFLLLREGRIEESATLYARARALGVSAADVGLEEAAIRAWRGDIEGAVAQAEALRGEREDADIDWQLALAHLAAGDFTRGWPLYDARLRRTFESPRRPYGFPEWDGARLDHGALLIMGEQGLGDEIMFASCYGEALERAGRGVIECEPRLAALFARSFPHAQVVGHVRSGADPAIAGDGHITCQIHAGSLPRFFRPDAQSFPQRAGYLAADPARVQEWRVRLRQGHTRRVIGLAWRGGLHHTRRALRSIPLAEFAPLLRIPDAEFVSLQHDDDGRDACALAAAAGVRVHAYPETLQDLDETAALVSALDGVASACGSVVHLCGALAMPTFVLTPTIAEWRYRARGQAMPWYPTVRLSRQSSSGCWSDVIEEVRSHLCKVNVRN